MPDVLCIAPTHLSAAVEFSARSSCPAMLNDVGECARRTSPAVSRSLLGSRLSGKHTSSNASQACFSVGDPAPVGDDARRRLHHAWTGFVLKADPSPSTPPSRRRITRMPSLRACVDIKFFITGAPTGGPPGKDKTADAGEPSRLSGPFALCTRVRRAGRGEPWDAACGDPSQVPYGLRGGSEKVTTGVRSTPRANDFEPQLAVRSGEKELSSQSPSDWLSRIVEQTAEAPEPKVFVGSNSADMWIRPVTSPPDDMNVPSCHNGNRLLANSPGFGNISQNCKAVCPRRVSELPPLAAFQTSKSIRACGW
eukprot:Hpha_TRINITY_DN12135_c0_g1::TRINITY_DN12135_c0_g1_i3::g.81753::m.81753